MIARIRKAMDEREGGFTLIELLVVMIIIGILAAIAIPMFLSQKSKAVETGLKSDASNIYKSVAAFQVDGTLDNTAANLPTCAYTGKNCAFTVKFADGTSEDTTVKTTYGSTTFAEITFFTAAGGDICVAANPPSGSTGSNAWTADANGVKRAAAAVAIAGDCL